MTGKTIPLTMPKAARGLEVSAWSASRFGTIKFSTVLIPVLQSSAMARGSPACSRRLRTGIRAPTAARSRSRRIIKHTRVRQAPRELPRMTHRQALVASLPAQRAKAPSVRHMERACSATSTAASVPIRLAAVKYPVMTAQRQVTGRKTANSRNASNVRISPIQLDAIHGANRYSRNATVKLNAML